MTRAELTTIFDAIEMRRNGALPDFLSPSPDVDLSRPPEPGSFRFSLEQMRHGTEDFPPSPAGPRHARTPAEGRRDSGAVSRRPGPSSPDRGAPIRRSEAPKESEERPQRTAMRKNETAAGAKKERPGQTQRNRKTAETRDKETPPADDGPQGEGAVAEKPDATRQTAAAAMGTGTAATGKAEADPNPPQSPAGQGVEPLAGDAETSRVVSAKAAVEADGMAKQPPVEGAATDAGGPAKSSAPANGKSAKSEKIAVQMPAKAAGKPTSAPGGAPPVEMDTPAAAEARAAVSVKGASPAAAQPQLQPQAAPVAVSQGTATATANGQAGSAEAAAPEASAPGRVARVGGDSQSGQTGLFQGHHAASGHVQGSGGATAPEGPAQPFHQDLMQQVAEKAVFHLRNGRAEARIDLKPESLGHLKLHVSTDHGQVTLRILTDSVWVRDMIESNISHLKNELQQHNLQIDRLDVSVSGGQQETGNGNDRASASPRNPAEVAGSGEGGAAPVGEETGTPHRAVARARVGMVDYFA